MIIANELEEQVAMLEQEADELCVAASRLFGEANGEYDNRNRRAKNLQANKLLRQSERIMVKIQRIVR